MNKAIVRACDRTIFWGMPLLVLLIPPAVWFPSYTMLYIKTTLLQCGAAVLFAAWAIRAFELGRVDLAKPLGRFIAPASVFAISALWSFIVITPSRDTSLEELCVRIPYFLLFFVTALSFSDFAMVRRAFTALMASSLLVSVYGMAQHFGLDPFDVSNTGRIQSTFGNANFYVGFLTLAIPAVAAAFDFADQSVRKKILPLYGLILVFGCFYYVCGILAVPLAWRAVLFCLFLGTVITLCAAWRLGAQSVAAVTLFLLVNNLFLTGSRSALIGLGSALIVFTVLLFIFVFKALSFKKTLLLSAAALLVAGMVTGGVLYVSYSDPGRLSVVSERKYYVKGALELFKGRPFFGHGIGTFKNNYPVVKSTASWAYNATCFEFVSNVYNEHLEILHDEGIAGILAWIWLLAVNVILSIMAVRTLSRRLHSPPQGTVTRESPALRVYTPSPLALLIALLSGTIAILVGNIFSLSMRYTATGFMFWFFLGIIAALSSSVLAAPGAETKSPENKSRAPVRATEMLLVALSGVAIIFSCRFFIADVYLNEAVSLSKDAYVPVDTTGRVFHDIFIEGTRYRSSPELWESAIRCYRRTLSLNPFCLRARYFFGNSFNRRWNMKQECNPAWGDRDGVPRTDAQRALEQYGYLIRQAPHTFEIDYELGCLYGKLGDLDRSVACYNDYKLYKPFFTKIHHALAETYLAKRDWANAAEALKDALDLNQRFTQGYLQLSAVYHEMGKADLAAEMLAKAREVSPRKADLSMVEVWSSMGEPDRALQSCREAVTRYPADTTAWYSLGWLYIQRKKFKDAITAYEKVVALDPSSTLGFINLSNLYYETGDIEGAKETYRKAVALDPALVESYVNKTGTGGR